MPLAFGVSWSKARIPNLEAKMELLIGGVVGAAIGVGFERITSLVQAVFFTFRHRHIQGEYTHDNGVVSITRRLGNRFVTESRQHNDADNWEGSFQIDDAYMHTGRGAYRHLVRQDDWGHHYIRLLENGDVSVQWENMSAGNRRTGALIWHKRR